MTISAALREYAETPDRFSHVPDGASVRRVADERLCTLEGPSWCSVSGVRVGDDDVEALLAEVRERIPAEKEPVWWIGPSARPTDLYEQLEALGLREPRDAASLLHALVLTRDPGGEAEGVTACVVETYEQFAAARELQWDAFDAPDDRRRKGRARLQEDFEEMQRLGVPVPFVAELDGRPAATGMAIPSDRGVFMIGGATMSWARGRGLYRALVRARWEYAVARGTPALVTHAVPDTSYPILRRLGFEDVCILRRLEDSGNVAGTMRLYSELADWFHLLTAPEDYAEEAAEIVRLAEDAVEGEARTLLELGCGGGNNASHLKRRFDCTLTDVSEEMLAVSRRLNPECEHLLGDMRTLRLGRTFDVVLVHDAVVYMTSEADLRAALETAFVHTRPGGVAIFLPDYTCETLAEGTRTGGHDGDRRALRYLEWVHDPNPGDATYEVDYLIGLREGDAPLRVVHEHHVEGVFGRDDWIEWLETCGFAVTVEPVDVDADVPGWAAFVARRPGAEGRQE